MEESMVAQSITAAMRSQPVPSGPTQQPMWIPPHYFATSSATGLWSMASYAPTLSCCTARSRPQSQRTPDFGTPSKSFPAVNGFAGPSTLVVSGNTSNRGQLPEPTQFVDDGRSCQCRYMGSNAWPIFTRLDWAPITQPRPITHVYNLGFGDR